MRLEMNARNRVKNKDDTVLEEIKTEKTLFERKTYTTSDESAVRVLCEQHPIRKIHSRKARNEMMMMMTTLLIRTPMYVCIQTTNRDTQRAACCTYSHLYGG